MQISFATLLAMGLTLTAAAPSPTWGFPKPPVTAVHPTVNPFLGKTQYVNVGYADKLQETIKSFLKDGDKLNAARARTVAQTVPTYIWISSSSDIAIFEKRLNDALKKSWKNPFKKVSVPFVIYNLPDRDCSAKASDGEFHLDQGGFKKYQAWSDKISKLISKPIYAGLDFTIVLEPDSLANIVTNLSVEKCVGAQDAYKEGIAYTITKFQQRNVALYIDAAHSNWLGWTGNLEPSAKLYKEVLDIANNSTRKANKIRGFATNVSNYNGYNPTTPDPIYGPGPDNEQWSELRYVTALAPFLEAEGLPAHFIIDQGRSGQQGIREEGGYWCNIDKSGYGILPTTNTGSAIVDALVWVKPGGESDGTSDETAARFDENCQSANAKVPAPEAGDWFNEFVKMLVKNANPALKPTY